MGVIINIQSSLLCDTTHQLITQIHLLRKKHLLRKRKGHSQIKEEKKQIFMQISFSPPPLLFEPEC